MSLNKKVIAVLVLAVTGSSGVANAYYDDMSWLDVEARVSAILDNMTQSEKIAFIRVDDGHMIPESSRFDIEGTVAYDSSLAVHVDGGNFGAGYPSQTAVAATWNINRAKEVGSALGYETRMAGGEQMLSPVANLYRTPFNGRTAESICGEDPFLCSVMAPALTNGIQSQGVQASAKHLIANEQEANRHNLDVIVDERPLRELYLTPFESLVKNADIASLMCGFNKINGEFACENHHVITDIVKGEWGYQGFVLSDFNAIDDGVKGAWAGTDLDMPSGLKFTESTLLPALSSGVLTQNVIDDKVKRNLRALVRYGFDERTFEAQELENTEKGLTASLDAAREGIVLLKNENSLLPLSKDAKIAVIGDFAQNAPSSPFGTAYSVAESNYVTELAGLQELANNSDNVVFLTSMALNPGREQWYLPESVNDGDDSEKGVSVEFYDNTDLDGDPDVSRTAPVINFDWAEMTNNTDDEEVTVDDTSATLGSFSARFVARFKPEVSGPHVLKVRADGPFKLYLDGELILESDGEPRASDVPDAVAQSVNTGDLTEGQFYQVTLEYSREQYYQSTLGGLNGVQLSWASLTPPEDISDYDAVIAVVGRNYETEGEGMDSSFDLPDQESTMVSNVIQANKNTVVVMHGGGGMNMLPWADTAHAIVHAWYTGQLGGQALAEIMYGDVNPSGKLPITLDRNIEDNPSYGSYSDIDDYVGDDALESMAYGEGIYVGYRGYDSEGKRPLYPFGFGLSYTTFAFSDLHMSSNTITEDGTIYAHFTVTNTGDRAGYEVAQLYVEPHNASVDRPVHELKGFSKIYLEAGESKEVVLPLDARSFAYYEESTDSWDVDRTIYTLQVGDSSANLPLYTDVKATQAISLTTRDSNPLPEPVQEAVQVDAVDGI